MVLLFSDNITTLLHIVVSPNLFNNLLHYVWLFNGAKIACKITSYLIIVSKDRRMCDTKSNFSARVMIHVIIGCEKNAKFVVLEEEC